MIAVICIFFLFTLFPCLCFLFKHLLLLLKINTCCISNVFFKVRINYSLAIFLKTQCPPLSFSLHSSWYMLPLSVCPSLPSRLQDYDRKKQILHVFPRRRETMFTWEKMSVKVLILLINSGRDSSYTFTNSLRRKCDYKCECHQSYMSKGQ